MRAERYDIVHTHTSKAGLLGRIAARLARVPVVIHTPHGHVFYGYYGTLITRCFVWMERFAAPLADRIIALTTADRDEHVNFGIADVDRFAVIHSGVDFARLESDRTSRTEVRRQLRLSDRVLAIATVGRLTAIKGQDVLLRAFAHVCSRLSPDEGGLRLVLVGDGEERDALEELALSLGISELVVFAGWREDTGDVLRALDIFVLPSINEGMGKALVEAMHVGLPCVATRVGGVPELIAHGREGLLVEPGNSHELGAALLRLIGDAEERQRLGQKARVTARAYSVEDMVEKIEDLYEQVLTEKGLAQRASPPTMR